MSDPNSSNPSPSRRRRRGSRGGRSRRRGNPENRPEAGIDQPGGPGYDGGPSDIELPDLPREGVARGPAAEAATVRPRIGDTRPAAALEPDSRSTQSDRGGRGGGRRRRGGGRSETRLAGGEPLAPMATTVTSTDDPTPVRDPKDRPLGRYLMCVEVRPQATQIAVLEGRALIEHYLTRAQDDASQIDGNIYLGRVQNVLPGMEAAFVDIGTPKNAVLYRGDVRYDPDDVEASDSGSSAPKEAEQSARIEQLLRPGQSLICQVTKNPIGAKGARLTQEVSLPGRFVVLVPNSSTYGISKRLDDNERKRLRRVLDEIRPEGHGIIVRTAAAGGSAAELTADVEMLVGQWNQIEASAKRAKAPALLHREPGLSLRMIREEFNSQFRGVLIDDEQAWREVRDYVARISPELATRVEYYDLNVEPLPLFERYHVHEQRHKALDRKVWLSSGGSLIIERTEALTVIDVNTGKNVGTSNLEETVYRNNLEAAEEIARQLRLRDIGGIIVIDFIDMEIAENREGVLQAFRRALALDKTRTQVFPISELGIVEMTRKRVSEGLVESFSTLCPICNGRGFVLDEELL
ncbi:MAG: Rne/Rng family ribonuclease [Actinobacteria bacterium]|nr:Rne/Rng family ribonuclease [Actinomycetota bacterium]